MQAMTELRKELHKGLVAVMDTQSVVDSKSTHKWKGYMSLAADLRGVVGIGIVAPLKIGNS